MQHQFTKYVRIVDDLTSFEWRAVPLFLCADLLLAEGIFEISGLTVSRPLNFTRVFENFGPKIFEYLPAFN